MAVTVVRSAIPAGTYLTPASASTTYATKASPSLSGSVSLSGDLNFIEDLHSTRRINFIEGPIRTGTVYVTDAYLGDQELTLEYLPDSAGIDNMSRIRLTGGGGVITESVNSLGQTQALWNSPQGLTYYSIQGEALKIDTSGRIRMPMQPLFSATDTRALDLTSVVLTSSNCYNQIDYNVGSCFNASTGRFTAPIAGYYEASAHFGSTTANTINVRIRKNGVANTGPLAEVYNQAGTGSTNNYARAIIYLAVGDYIDFEASRLTTAAGIQHKRFLVRLIQ